MTEYNQAACSRALQSLKTAPIDLDDADFAQLAILDPDLEVAAVAAKSKAMVALVPLQTKAVDVDVPLDADAMADVVAKAMQMAVAPLTARLVAAEAEIAALKSALSVERR